MCKESGRLTQGYKSTAGTDTVIFLSKKGIENIPSECVVTNARTVLITAPKRMTPIKSN